MGKRIQKNNRTKESQKKRIIKDIADVLGYSIELITLIEIIEKLKAKDNYHYKNMSRRRLVSILSLEGHNIAKFANSNIIKASLRGKNYDYNFCYYILESNLEVLKKNTGQKKTYVIERITDNETINDIRKEERVQRQKNIKAKKQIVKL